MDPGYLLAFSAGIFGGFGHCMGMCGPFVTSYILYERTGSLSLATLAPQFIYNAGRITTYTVLGSVAGLTGSFLNLTGRIAGIQDMVSILAGLIMVLMGAGITGFLKGRMAWEGQSSTLVKGLKLILEGATIWKYYPLGLLLGFMPCGLSYSIFMGAAATGGLLQGGLFAFFFGLGTLPALLVFGIAATALSLKMRGLLYKLGGLAVILMGILFIIRGVRAYGTM